MDRRSIGVFDSGVGGISVLREAVRLLPGEHFIYYGDNANAPYGTRSREEILRLSLDAADRLTARGVKALVIACNTATSAAAQTLRTRLPIPVIGVEPALKPAALSVRRGRILVLATRATLSLEKFQTLMDRWGENAVPVVCTGLMEFVERGEIDSPALDAYLADIFAPWQGEEIAAAVLGCTHYPFVRGAIARALPGVPLFDGSEGVARQLARVLREHDLLGDVSGGTVEFHSSSPEAIAVMRRLFCLPMAEKSDNLASPAGF